MIVLDFGSIQTRGVPGKLGASSSSQQTAAAKREILFCVQCARCSLLRSPVFVVHF